MLSSYKLPLVFDAESLKADLRQILSTEWVAHFNRGYYYEGEWKGFALRSTTGRVNQLHRPPTDTREATDTAVLARCHNFRHVLNAFKCPMLSARLLSLSPGSKLLEHEDYFGNRVWLDPNPYSDNYRSACRVFHKQTEA